MAPTLKWLSEQYGIAVFPVSLDGGGLPDFPNPRAITGWLARSG
jgi:conjugal transfer pilus assembly protein TraF